MKTILLSLLVALGVSACATRPSDADRLALYLSHAGAPVSKVIYREPIGWDRIDDQHVALQLRPRESWLLTLSGPCLNWGNGSPFLGLQPFSGMTLAKFDKVIVPGSQITCMIQEIRPLDMKAIRSGETALRERAKAQAEGT